MTKTLANARRDLNDEINRSVALQKKMLEVADDVNVLGSRRQAHYEAAVKLAAAEVNLRSRLEMVENKLEEINEKRLKAAKEAARLRKEEADWLKTVARTQQDRIPVSMFLPMRTPLDQTNEFLKQRRLEAEKKYADDLRSFVTQLSADTKTPMEEFRKAFGQLVEASKLGMISARDFARGEAFLTKRFMDMQEQTFNRLAPAVRGSPFVSGLTAAARQEQRPAEKINKKLDEVKREIRGGLDQINNTLSQGTPLTVGVFNNN